jgi:hypothetical protein
VILDARKNSHAGPREHHDEHGGKGEGHLTESAAICPTEKGSTPGKEGNAPHEWGERPRFLKRHKLTAAFIEQYGRRQAYDERIHEG